MQKSVIKQIRLYEFQDETLKKMKHKYHIDVANFIRQAITEKLGRDYKSIIEKIKEPDCPF